VAGTCECGNEPSCSIKREEFLDLPKTVSFSSRTLLHAVSKSVRYIYIDLYLLLVLCTSALPDDG